MRFDYILRFIVFYTYFLKNNRLKYAVEHGAKFNQKFNSKRLNK